MRLKKARISGRPAGNRLDYSLKLMHLRTQQLDVLKVERQSRESLWANWLGVTYSVCPSSIPP